MWGMSMGKGQEGVGLESVYVRNSGEGYYIERKGGQGAREGAEGGRWAIELKGGIVKWPGEVGTVDCGEPWLSLLL